jgi:predicted outer membrane repeat protein
VGGALVEFTGNSAGGAGGAVYTECDTLAASCRKVLGKHLGAPLAHQQPQIFFRGNRAGAYGHDMATNPSQLSIPGPSGVNLGQGADRQAALTDTFREPGYPDSRLALVPGQERLNLSVVLLDGLGQVVRGSATRPLAHVLRSLLCAPGPSHCTYSTTLAAPVFAQFDTVTGIARTVEVSQATACSMEGVISVSVSLSESNPSPFLARTIDVACLPCARGQSRVELGSVWTCASCAPDQYVIDPNRHPCRPCPVGATCDGAGWTPGQGSRWEIVADTIRVAACDPGFILIRDPRLPLLDQCYRCPGTPYPGYFSVKNASYPAQLVALNASSVTVDPALCIPCLRGASCERGGDSVVPFPGFWKRIAPTRRSSVAAASDVEIYRCLPGPPRP